MNTYKRRISFLLTLVLLLSCLPVPAGAQEGVAVSDVYISAVELADSDQLETGYVGSLFGGGTAAWGVSARARLNALGKQLYDHLKSGIEEIAAGERSSATIAVADSLVDGWGAQRSFAVTDANEAFSQFLGQFGVSAVIDALLYDCPYELYWYDKVSGVGQTASCATSGGDLVITGLTFVFQVAGPYRGSGYDANAPTVKASATTAAVAAAEYAATVAAQYASLADFEKLTALKDAICTLTEYNHAAASGGSFSSTPDPWQLVYVFDRDPTTSVVCEGYSKAFQYLCDLSAFSGDVCCYTVSGVMTGGTGAGDHMWNIVSVNGKNYLTDITNSDYGSCGQDGSLFLAGASGSVAGGYLAGGTSYAYDPADISLWGEEILTLSALPLTAEEANGTEPPETEPQETEPQETEPEVTEMTQAEFLAALTQAKEAGQPLQLNQNVSLTESVTVADAEIVLGTNISLTVKKGAVLTLSGDVDITGDSTGGIWVEYGGTVTVASGARVSFLDTTLRVTSGGKVNNLGAIRTNGTIKPESNGIVVLAEGTIDNHGTVLTSGGTDFLIQGRVYNTGTITIKEGSTIYLLGTTKNDGTIELEENSFYAIEGSYTGDQPVVTESMDASGTCGTGISWVFDEFDGTLTISGTGAMVDMDAGSGGSVPWSDYLGWIETIVVEEGITYIGNEAFLNCPNLTAVSLPDTLTGMGSSVLQNAAKLTRLRIPSGVTTIPGAMVSGCSALTEVNIPAGTTTIGIGAFSGCSALTELTIPETVTTIATAAFRGTGLKNVTLPAGLTLINDSLFDGCAALTAVTLPENIGSIGGYAFRNCAALTALDIPYTVTSLGREAFSGCAALSAVELPVNLVSIGISCFQGCGALKTAVIPAGVKVIPESAFAQSGLTEIVIPEGVHTVGNRAFQDCDSLTGAVLPSTGATLGNQIFAACDVLKSVTIPAGVTAIPMGTFQYCVSLKEIAIPNTVTAIGKQAFDSCTALTAVTIPNSVKTVGTDAFSMCKNLASVQLSTAMTKLEEGLFYQCSALKSITIPENITAIDAEVFRCSGLTAVTVPDSVTQILDMAFNDCPSLKSAVLPKNLTTLHYGLFMQSGLESVTIPASVTQIDDYAFGYCDALTEITFAGSAPTIADQVFYGVTASVTCPADATWTDAVKLPYGGTLTWSGAQAPAEEFPFSDYEWEVLRLANRERLENELHPLIGFAGIQDVCDIRAREIIESFSHTRPDGTSCFTALKENGIYYGYAAENIAYGYGSPAAVMNGWMNSSGHRANILNENLDCLGVGEQNYNWVQLFVDAGTVSSMKINAPAGLTVETGTEIGEMDLVAVLEDSIRGTCYLPVEAEYCTGYNAGNPGTQTVTVSVLGVSATFTVTVAGGHVHTWADATCTAPRTCTDCGATEGEALGHDPQVLPGTAATCTTNGLTDAEQCSRCAVMLKAHETIWALGHTSEILPAVAPTCTEAGLSEGEKCQRCGEILTPQEAVPALGHTEEGIPGKKATCTESGLTEGKKCSVCGEILTPQETIPALGHTEEAIPGKKATCTEPGLTEGKKCSVCGEILTPQEAVPAAGHSFVDDVCTVCGALRRGDYDGNKAVTAEDAQQLLWHTLFPEEVPLNAEGDLNRDGTVDFADAIYLLLHTLFPANYPL